MMITTLRLPPPLADRKSEIAFLKEFLKKVGSSNGGFLMLYGESGVGKTRMLEEVKQEAQHQGFYLLASKCLPGSATPLLPFYTMLKSVHREHLLAESFPSLDALFVVNKGGIILSKYEKSAKNIDPDIFLGMVTAVENFIRDSITQIEGKGSAMVEEKLGVMRHGEFTIVNMPGKRINVVALVEGVENEFLLADLSNLIERIEANFESFNQDALSPMLRDLVESDKYSKVGLEATEKRAGVFENVLRGLKRLSKEKPVLLIIDDMQWADSSTLSLLHHIARDIGAEKLGILCAARSEEISPASLFSDVLDEMKAEKVVEVLSLQPLDKEGVCELIESILAGYVDSEFKEKVYSETEGNPLFVIEVLKYLADKALLRKEGDIWVYDREEIRIPDRIYEIIREKVNRLSQDEFEVLESASVLGSEFTATLLEKIVGMEKIKMLRALSRLEKIHGLVKQEGERYRFDPAKVRDVIYQEMGKELRKAMHEMVGKILEEEYKQGNGEKILSAFYHYREAGRGDKLKEYGCIAAEKLVERFAYEEALEVYQDLYNALEKRVEEERSKGLSLLEKMVEVSLAAGLYLNAQKYLGEMLTFLGSDKAKASKVYAKQAEVFLKMGEHEKAMQSINLAFELIKDGLASEVEIAKLLTTKGYIHERSGNYEEAFKCQERALDIFSKHQMESEAGYCYGRLGSTCYYLERYEESLAYLKMAEEIFTKRRDRQGLSFVYNNIGMVYYELEDFESAKYYLEKTVEIKETIHELAGLGIAKNNLGNVYFEKGEVDRAIALYLECKALCRKTGDNWMFVYNQIDLAEAYAVKGDWERYTSAIAEAMERAKKIGIEKEVEEAKGEIEKNFKH